jgi:uncharacterized damage-inducible protein DinB
MEWYEILIGAYEGTSRTLERALDGLIREDLDWQVKEDSNSIGWLVWHLTRAQDTLISGIMGDEQLWIKGGWHRSFGRPADATDVGVGHSPEQVAAFRSPDAATLLAYHQAVTERTVLFLRTLRQADLDRKYEDLLGPPATVGQVFLMVLDDNIQHTGQVAFLRGLRTGRGWLPF